MFDRSLILSSALALSIIGAFVGCAAPSSTEDEVETAASQDELTSNAKQLVGGYWTHAPAAGGFGRLRLEASGRYSASLDANGTVVCVQSPCLVPESGTWNATKTSTGLRLRLTPSGGASRFYSAVKGTTLTLTRSGRTETLNMLATNGCLDAADCGANEVCGPRLCLMYCAVNDPFCCGPSTCQPEPPPPPSCWGAWLDENGLCRTPADGAYPASCCAGMTTTCGSAKCGAGEVCCNPLAGICTKPGMDCAQ